MWSDNETAIDLLGFQYLTKAVCGIVKDEQLLPATIGVYGDWGGGKSSLIQMATAELEKDDDIGICWHAAARTSKWLKRPIVPPGHQQEDSLRRTPGDLARRLVGIAPCFRNLCHWILITTRGSPRPVQH